MGARPYKREIFMQRNPRYQMCDVLLHDGDYMICAAPDGREFIAKPGYGTWCEIGHVDLLYKLKWAEEAAERNRGEKGEER